MPIEFITADDFEPYIGEDFVLPGNGTAPAIPFKLTAVKRSARQMPGAKRDPFIVSFHAPSQYVYPQNMYRLRHASFEYQDIFLVPTGQTDAGVDYNAYYS